MHERGTIFYQQNSEGNISRIVYFSTSRIIDYAGKADEALARLIKAEGHLVETIELDEFRDSITILQLKNGSPEN